MEPTPLQTLIVEPSKRLPQNRRIVMSGTAAAVATIVSAIIGAGVSAGLHSRQAKETERARREARMLGERERKDILAERGQSRKEGKDVFEFQKKEAALGRRERQTERFRGSLMQRANQFASQLNTDQQLKSRLLQQNFVRRR